MVLATDVTQQVMARQQLAVAEDEMRTAMNAAELGYWNIDPLTNQMKCDDRTRHLFGLPPDEEVDLEVAIDAIHEKTGTGCGKSFKKLYNPKVEDMWTLNTGCLIRSPSGSIIYGPWVRPSSTKKGRPTDFPELFRIPAKKIKHNK
jgi:PAS domain-containing protein